MDRRFLKTEQAIRNTYFSLLKAGNRKITVAEIARKADIDRKTFYLHYPSVDDIVIAYAKEKADQFIHSLETNRFFLKPYDLTIFFDSLNDLMKTDQELFRCLSRNHQYDFFWDKAHTIVRDAVTDLFHNPEILNEKEQRTYADFYTYGIIAVYRRWLETEDSMTLEELGNYLSKISDTAVRIYFDR